ncbi:hypothetical protein GCM10020254_77250 [Streptomyces goshikiensis]
MGGAELLIDGDVPPGAGLSSSAALECAVATALRALYGIALTAPETALLAQRAENAFVGVPCGVMDQMASMCCTPGHALFLDTRSLALAQEPLDLAAAGLRLLVIDTGTKHALADGEYAARRRECELAAVLIGVDALRDIESVAQLNVLHDPVLRARARHVVTENARVLRTVRLLRSHRLRETGPLLTASHLSLRDDFAVSLPRAGPRRGGRSGGGRARRPDDGRRVRGLGDRPGRGRRGGSGVGRGPARVRRGGLRRAAPLRGGAVRRGVVSGGPGQATPRIRRTRTDPARARKPASAYSGV